MQEQQEITFRWTDADKARLAQAVRATVGAITRVPGLDCQLYAVVGAALLRRHGVDAEAEAGSAIWRVGPGDCDLIAHAIEMPGKLYTAAGGSGRAIPAHAWIRVTTDDGRRAIVDLTTWQLKRKAADLDASDNGHTNVVFCPPYLWVAQAEATKLTPNDVRLSFEVGVYSYVAKPELRDLLFPPSLEDEYAPVIAVAAVHFNLQGLGASVQVLSCADGGVREADETASIALVPLDLSRRS